MDEIIHGVSKQELILFGNQELDQECAQWLEQHSINPQRHKKIKDSIVEVLPPSGESFLHEYEKGLIAETANRVIERYAPGMYTPTIGVFEGRIPESIGVGSQAFAAIKVNGAQRNVGSIFLRYQTLVEENDGGIENMIDVVAEETLHLALAWTGEAVPTQTKTELEAAIAEIRQRTDEEVGTSLIKSLERNKIGASIYNAPDSPIIVERIGDKKKIIAEDMQFAVDFLRA